MSFVICRFSFNKKSEEKKKKDVKKSDGEQQQQKKTKKVQAVKPVSKKPVKERPYSFEEPFPEVSGKPIDILKEYKLVSHVIFMEISPTPRLLVLFQFNLLKFDSIAIIYFFCNTQLHSGRRKLPREVLNFELGTDVRPEVSTTTL